MSGLQVEALSAALGSHKNGKNHENDLLDLSIYYNHAKR